MPEPTIAENLRSSSNFLGGGKIADELSRAADYIEQLEARVTELSSGNTAAAELKRFTIIGALYDLDKSSSSALIRKLGYLPNMGSPIYTKLY